MTAKLLALHEFLQRTRKDDKSPDTPPHVRYWKQSMLGLVESGNKTRFFQNADDLGQGVPNTLRFLAGGYKMSQDFRQWGDIGA